MAIYHLSVKYISRNQGRSSVSAAAYRSGEKLRNEYDGVTHDYGRKRRVVHKEILLPENAPREFQNRQILWNAVEKSEKQCNARTAREIEIALPNELSLDEQIKLVRDYVNDNFVNLGMCADITIHHAHTHDKDKENIEAENDINIYANNPHAHILLTTRPITKEGFCENKQNYREYNKKQYVHLWREQWANAQNREFANKGINERVSHKSNIEQGLDKEPTIHLGHNATALERRGIHTDRGNQNRAIRERNKARQLRQSNNIQRGRGTMAEQKELDRLQQQEREAYKIKDRSERERELRRIRDERVKLQRQKQKEREQTRDREKDR